MADEEEDSNIARLLSPGKRDSKKRQYSFYINEALYKRFMDACKDRDISGSKVISAYMQDFVDKYGK